jgi:hypothetical protein
VLNAQIVWVISGLSTDFTITFTDGFSQLAMAPGFSVRSTAAIMHLQQVETGPQQIVLTAGCTGSFTISSPIETLQPNVSANVLCNDPGVSVQYSFDGSEFTPITSSLADPGYSLIFPPLSGEQ